MSVKYVYLLLPLYAHEDREAVVGALLKELHLEYSDKVKYQVIKKLPAIGTIDSETLILTDALHRLAKGDGNKTAKIIFDLLEGSNRSLWIPGVLDLRLNSPHRATAIKVCSLLSNLKPDVKSARIRESLHIRSKMYGSIREKNGISRETREAVAKELRSNGFKIRETARQFKISATSCFRISKSLRGGSK